MPTVPTENSPFAASLLQREMGRRTPGTPSVAGNPTPQAGVSRFPNPPGVSMAPPGRPPTITLPAPLGPPGAVAPAPARPEGGPTVPVASAPDPAMLQAQEALRVREALGPMPRVFTELSGLPPMPV